MPRNPGASGHGPGGNGEERPPILGSWSALYAAVLVELLLVIGLCHWLSGRGK